MTDSKPDQAKAQEPAPRSIETSLPIMLLRVREMVMEYFRPFLAAHDLTDAQWRVLRVLHEGGPLEPTEISARGLVLTPSLTRILRTLESRGLIARQPHPRDGRRHQVRLTRDAEALIAELAPHSEEGYRRIEERFGREDTERLLELLARFCER